MASQEQALLLKWQRQRDAEAFAAVVTRYSGLVYGTCRRLLHNPHDAEDLAQECFLRLAQADAGSIGYIGGWLHRVASNLCLDRLKVERRRREREEAFTRSAERAEPRDHAEILQRVDEAINALPERLRFPVVAHFLEGRTHETVALTLGISRPAVTRRIERGIERVRKSLHEQQDSMTTPALALLLREELPEEAPAALKAALGKWAVAGLPRVPPKPATPAIPARPRAIAWLGALGGAAIVLAFALSRLWNGPAYVQETAPSPSGPSPQRAAVIAALRERREAPAAPEQLALASNEAVVSAEEASEPAFTPLPYAEGPEEFETVEVRCLDSADNPVPGAEVFLLHVRRLGPPMQGSSRPEDHKDHFAGPTVAGHDGVARFTHVPKFPGDRALWMSMGRLAYARVPGQLVGAVDIPSAFHQKVDDPMELLLVPVMEVQGRVSVPQGFNPAAVTVRVLGLRAGGSRDPRQGFFAPGDARKTLYLPQLFETRADATGAFTLHDLPSMGGVYLAAEGPRLGQAQFYTLDSGKSEPVEMALQPEAILAGMATFEPSGEPAPGYVVQARPDIHGVSHSFEAVTDAEGRFRLDGLPATAYRVTVPMGVQPSEWAAAVQDLSLAPGENRTDFGIQLAKGGLVSGTVRDASTKDPVAGIPVYAHFPAERLNPISPAVVASTLTGADGRYCFRAWPAPLRLSHGMLPERFVRSRMPQERAVTVKNGIHLKDVDFKLTPNTDPKPARGMAHVDGRVVDTEGQPVAGALVFEKRGLDEPEFHPGNKVARTDSDGRFYFGANPDQAIAVVVYGPGIRSATGVHLTPESNGRHTLEDFVVERLNGTLSGTVTDEAGAPIETASVIVWTDGFNSGDPITTDAEGAFTAAPVPEDTPLHVRIQKPGHRPLETETTATPDQQFILQSPRKKTR